MVVHLSRMYFVIIEKNHTKQMFFQYKAQNGRSKRNIYNIDITLFSIYYIHSNKTDLS